MSKLPKDFPNDDKFNYALKLIEQGYDRSYISNDMGYSRVDSLDRFLKKFGITVDKKTDIYIRQVEDNSPENETAITMEDTCPTNDIQTNTTVSLEAKEDNCIPSVRQVVEENEKLNNILNSSTEIFEMLEWFREMKAKYPTVDIPLNFNIDYNKSNVIKTTVRLDEDVWNTFSDICKNKYSHLSKVDILSQILKNFNDENK